MQLEAKSRLDNTLTSVFVFVDLKNPSFGPWELQEEQEDMKIMMDHAASVCLCAFWPHHQPQADCGPLPTSSWKGVSTLFDQWISFRT